MFTGLISDVGEIIATEDRAALRRLRIATSYSVADIPLGASIACSGPCLTVVEKGTAATRDWFEVEAAAETLARTTVGTWAVGTRINLERSLRIGDELGGHIVTGHVDGIAMVTRRETMSEAETGWGATTRFHIRAPKAISHLIAEKGSIALDGTSLTVNSVEGDVFSILLIPHTLAVTTWADVREGSALNIEADLMARYAARLVEARHA